jgi:hypothetical protein
MTFIQLSHPYRYRFPLFPSLATHGNGASLSPFVGFPSPRRQPGNSMAKASTNTSTYTIVTRGLLPSRALKSTSKVTAQGATAQVTGLLTNRGTVLHKGQQVQVDLPPFYLRFRDGAADAALSTRAYAWALVEVQGWLAPLGEPSRNQRGFYQVPSAMIIVDKIVVIRHGDPVPDDD